MSYIPGRHLNASRGGAGVKITNSLLTKAGYRFVPSHAYAKQKYDEEWITGSELMRNSFPRFHILRDGKNWFIHLDNKGEHKYHHGKTDSWSDKVTDEIKRISRLGNQPMPLHKGNEKENSAKTN